ncbi:hypothetical protein ACIBI9_20895 [Nonomuraea sp. NPDC050451]|uniref:hypothetical protein n=1 Tax=Nonomuraea sp. NPDC050451 TaxID=3364364 RepID=UPI00379D55CC
MTIESRRRRARAYSVLAVIAVAEASDHVPVAGELERRGRMDGLVGERGVAGRQARPLSVVMSSTVRAACSASAVAGAAIAEAGGKLPVAAGSSEDRQRIDPGHPA